MSDDRRPVFFLPLPLRWGPRRIARGCAIFSASLLGVFSWVIVLVGLLAHDNYKRLPGWQLALFLVIAGAIPACAFMGSWLVFRRPRTSAAVLIGTAVALVTLGAVVQLAQGKSVLMGLLVYGGLATPLAISGVIVLLAVQAERVM